MFRGKIVLNTSCLKYWNWWSISDLFSAIYRHPPGASHDRLVSELFIEFQYYIGQRVKKTAKPVTKAMTKWQWKWSLFFNLRRYTNKYMDQTVKTRSGRQEIFSRYKQIPLLCWNRPDLLDNMQLPISNGQQQMYNCHHARSNYSLWFFNPIRFLLQLEWTCVISESGLGWLKSYNNGRI